MLIEKIYLSGDLDNAEGTENQLGHKLDLMFANNIG